MYPHSRFVTKLCRLLVITSILLAGVPAQVGAAASAAHPTFRNEGKTELEGVPTPEPVSGGDPGSSDAVMPAPEAAPASSDALVPALEKYSASSDALMSAPEAPPVPVRLRLEVQPDVADPGDLVTYTLTLTNTGDAPLTDLLVNAAFVPELIYVPPDSERGPEGQYYPASYILRYTLDVLEAGKTAVLTFQARLAQGAAGDLPCTAYVGDDPTKAPGATAVVQAGRTRAVRGADTGTGLDAGWKLLYNPPVVAAFSGSAAFNYPLELPPGRNGLQPNVNLSYSSRAVDGTVYWVDSEWVGMGWSIDTIDITRRGVWYTYGAQGNYEWLDLAREFSLVINGTSYRLTPATSNVTFYGRYYAENAPELYVELKTGSTNNLKGDYWIVRTPNGTRYRLGYNFNSEQKMWRVNCSPNTACSDDASPQEQVYRWRVDEVTDSFNNRMIFDYYEHTAHNREYASYPANIYYNSYGGGWASRVEFVSTPAGFDPGQFSPIFRTRRQLDGVRVYHLGQLLREYVFNYETEVHANASIERRLTQIKQCGRAGAAGRCLPPTTFAYQDLNNKVWELGGHQNLCDLNANPKWPFTDTSACQYWGEQFPYPRLVRVDNGYGAVTAFTYSPEYTNGSEPQRYYAVIQAQTWDGAQYVYPDPTAPRTTYDYVGPCWDSPNQGCDIPIQESNALIGFFRTTARRQGYDGAAWQNLAGTLHQFDTTSYRTMGREIQTRWLDGADSVLRTTDRVWNFTSGNNGYAYLGEERETDFSDNVRTSTRVANTYDEYANPTATYQYGAEEPIVNAGFEGGGAGWQFYWTPTPASVATAEHFAGLGSLQLQGSNNGGAYQDITGLVAGESYILRAWVKRKDIPTTARFQLGIRAGVASAATTPSTMWSEVTLRFDADATGMAHLQLHYLGGTGIIYVDEVALARAQDVGDERSTHRFFFNLIENDRWFIGLKWGENLFTGITPNVGGTSLKTQTIWYYDDYSYNSANRGQSAQINRGLVTMMGQGLLASGQRFATTRYDYDQSWGLPISETDPEGNKTVTAYDGVYHLYATEVCQADNAPVRQCSQTEYYGVAGIAADHGLPGQIKRIGDLNGMWTEHRYDDFGRLTKVARPGDSPELPTTEYRYRDGTHLWISTSLREQSGQTGTLDSEVFYDGQGRAILARAEATGGQWTVGSKAYDALGRLALEYVVQLHNSQTQVFEAESRSDLHFLGSAQGGAWVSPNVTAAHSNANFLTFGPYEEPVAAGPGQKACFLLAVDVVAGRNPYDPAAILDVYDATANRVLARQELKRGDFVGGLTNMSEFCLAFSSSGRATHELEYRVYWQDYVKMAHDRVQVIWEHPTAVDAPHTLTLYDALGRVVHVVKPDGATTNTGYSGRRIIVMDANNNRRDSAVDAFGRLVAVYEYEDEGGDPHTTTYAYDVQDNLTRVTDAVGHTTTMNYDELGHMTWMTDPDMGRWSYDYDAVGNVITQTDQLAQVMVFAYDELNRLVSKQKADGEMLVEYTYDAFSAADGQYGRGRRTGMIDASGSTAWIYDQRGRLTKETKTISGFGALETRYTYDALGRVATMTYPDGEVIANHYDTQGLQDRLARSNGTFTYVENVDYNALEQPTLIEFGAADLNLQTSYTYNSQNARLESLATTGPFGPLQNLTYTYDAVGNVLSITDGMNSGQMQHFQYDGLDRLVHGWTTGGGQGVYDESQTYDAIGNITEKDGVTYVYDPNHPHAVKDLVYGSMQVGTYSYDANGNMINRNDNGAIYAQSFNIENRLASVTSGSTTTAFVYDGNGKRVKKIESDGDITVYVGDSYEASYPALPGKLFTGKLTNVGSTWQAVQLPYRYNSMVVIASPSYESGDAPAVARVRNATGNSFQIRVQNPSDQPLSGYTVHYLVVEEGVYTQAQHGIKMEAVKYNSTVADRATSWVGESRNYRQSYTQPVVLGQVMTAYDTGWSVFWARGSSQGNPPSSSSLYTGKHIGQDTDITRTNETIGYVVIEAGSGSIGGLAYIAALGPDTVSGMDNTPPFLYAINGPSAAEVAIASAAAMDGGDGGWPVLYGDDPVSASQLKLAFDEDQIADAERAHLSEEVAYIVFSGVRTRTSRDVVTKYYAFVGQRVAMRVIGTTDVVYYLHGDHLGSTSLVTTGNPVLIGGVPVPPGFLRSRQLYTPYGQTRWSQGVSPTDRQFTGQRNEASLGLYDYNARFYDPFLGRFISADTIRSKPGNPQALNRYAYALGNPLTYTDPSGNFAWVPFFAAAGAIAATITYAVTTPPGEFNVGEAVLAAGIGAVGGVLLGTGAALVVAAAGAAAAGATTVGAAAISTATIGGISIGGASVASTLSVGTILGLGGLATVRTEANYVRDLSASGESFDCSDIGNDAAWSLVPSLLALAGVNGGVSYGAAGVTSGLSSVTRDLWNGKRVDVGQAVGEGLSGGTSAAISGGAGAIVEKATGLPVGDLVGEVLNGPVSDLVNLLFLKKPTYPEVPEEYLNYQYYLQKTGVRPQ